VVRRVTGVTITANFLPPLPVLDGAITFVSEKYSFSLSNNWCFIKLLFSYRFWLGLEINQL
jgi:hypothetical protein